MRADAPEITALRAKVKAADEEFHVALRCHEAWKPAAYDNALHDRVGHSYAANTFIVVRQALRREMLLGLLRLWDTDKRAVGMSRIASTLSDKRIVNALAQETSSHWGQNCRLYGLEDTPAEQRPELIRLMRDSDAKFGREQGYRLRESASQAVEIIRSYENGGGRQHTLVKLMTLRNERLAHRQVEDAPKALEPDILDTEIEDFYQDMSRLLRLLQLAVHSTDYDPAATAAIAARHAAFFWNGVRGERTEGHPDYRPVQKPR